MGTPKDEPTCNICGTSTVGKYCHYCGQEDTAKRLSFTGLITDFFNNVLALEKSGFATMWHIMRDPRAVIENYWNGKRRYYQPPSRLIVYASVVIGLHSLWHDNLIIGLAFTEQPQVGFLTFFLILFPLSSFLTYFKRERNLIEHIAANFYLFSTWSIFAILFYDLLYLFIGENGWLSVGIFSVLMFLMLRYDAIVFSTDSALLKKVLFGLLQFLLIVGLVVVVIGAFYLSGQVDIKI